MRKGASVDGVLKACGCARREVLCKWNPGMVLIFLAIEGVCGYGGMFEAPVILKRRVNRLFFDMV